MLAPPQGICDMRTERSEETKAKAYRSF